MKIVVLDGYMLNPGDLSWDSLHGLGKVTIYDRTPQEESTIAKRIDDAEVVIVNKTIITDNILEKTPKVKYIGVTATGYNNIDINAASKRGITVTNVPTYGTKAVAQYVFALLLELCHHVDNHNHSVQRGDWANCPDFSFWNSPLIELSEKTLGIIGFGKIGQTTATIAQAFSMNVVVYDLYPDTTKETETLQFCSLDEVYKRSDIISLHVPLTKDTDGMINKDSIAKMKDGVMLINTSRGQLIVEQDLVNAVNNTKVYAAALDVVATEPIKPDNILLGVNNIVITPHIAWATIESRKRLFNTTIANIKNFQSNTPINIVN